VTSPQDDSPSAAGASGPSSQPPGWERQALEKLLNATLDEQRRSRKWNNFFKGLIFLYLFLTLFAVSGWFSGGDGVPTGAHTAVVDLKGVIDADGSASAEKIISALQQAFKDHNTVGVILRINSPGGSPVQAGYINDEILRLRKLYPKIPLYAVVTDICASGGYYVAVAADQIYVDKASLIGSVGVIMDGFGFTGLMEKLGVERRALHAGDNKNFLDPFAPINPKHVEQAQAMLNQVHQQFIEVVRKGRGKRLHETPEMFSGFVWSGEEGVKLGLADALGSTDYVAREVLKAPDLVDYNTKENIAERLAKKIGAGATEAAGSWLTRSSDRLR
jgi:protease-4